MPRKKKTTGRPKVRRRVRTLEARVANATPSEKRSHHRKKGRPARGAGRLEVFQRLLVIEKLMLGGATQREIVHYCRTVVPGEKEWTVQDETAKIYMNRVWGYWEEDSRTHRRERRNKMRAQMNLYLRTSLEMGRMQAVGKAIELLCRFDGLFEPDRVEVSINEVTDEEARVVIEHAYSTLQLIDRERERLGDVTSDGEANGGGTPTLQ